MEPFNSVYRSPLLLMIIVDKFFAIFWQEDLCRIIRNGPNVCFLDKGHLYSFRCFFVAICFCDVRHVFWG